MDDGSISLMEGSCGICKSELVEPKILPCIHTFCKRCLVNGVRSANRQSAPFYCPLCKTPHSLNKEKINALQNNYFATTPRPKSSSPKNKIDRKQNDIRVVKRRPVSSVSRIDFTRSEIKKFRCLKHPNGSVYCKTCEVFQCMMCRNNKEHRGHVLIEAGDLVNQVDSDDEVSETDSIFLSVLHQHHLTGQTEEICQRAMHSVRDQASFLMEEINNRASEVIKKIEEEKLMLLKNLTIAEAQKLQTIRKALECANKVSRIHRSEIQKRQLPEIPTQEEQNNASSPEQGGKAKKTALQLESSLQSLGITFVPYGSVRPVLGELNKVESTSGNDSEEEVQLRHPSDNDRRTRKTPEYRHTVSEMHHQFPSHYNRVIGEATVETDDADKDPPTNGLEEDDEDQLPVVTPTPNPPDTPRPQPAHRKLERLYPPKPVEHRPLPPIPAPRNIVSCGPMEQ